MPFLFSSIKQHIKNTYSLNIHYNKLSIYLKKWPTQIDNTRCDYKFADCFII